MSVCVKLTVFLLAFSIGTIVSRTCSESSPGFVATGIQSTARFMRIEPQPRVYNVGGFWDTKVDSNSRLLETGEMTVNEEDFHPVAGGGWLALTRHGRRDELVPLHVKLRNIDRSGSSVSAIVGTSPPVKSMFLVRKSNRLRAGNVDSVFWEKEDPEVWTTMGVGFDKSFRLNGQEFRLRTELAVSEENERILLLFLERDGARQMLHYILFNESGDYVAVLKWAGDLDHDGRPDLYLDFYNYEKGSYNTGLFLSSEAKNGELVGKIEYYFLGC